MDGRGRLAEPLKRPGPRSGRRARASASWGFVLAERLLPPLPIKIASRISSFMRFWVLRLDAAIPRFTGIATSELFLVASSGYCAVRGDVYTVIVSLRCR